MKNWIKENLVLAIGLTLPILLIVLFFVATVIPKSMGTPPQYEMLFSTVKYEYQNKSDYVIDFKVKDKKLMVTAKKKDDINKNYSRGLMLYDGKNETVREIELGEVKIEIAANSGEMILEETNNMTIDTSSVSPDGYVLEGKNYGGGGLLGGLFGGDYRSSGYHLKKGNVGYEIPNAYSDYNYNQLQFLGWIVKK